MKTKKKSVQDGYKNIKIAPDIHEEVKKYCDRNGMNIYNFVERSIIDYLKKLNK